MSQREPRSKPPRSAENRALEFVRRDDGRPLEAQAIGFTEPRFSHHFSDIRVHADGEAASIAQHLGARAFTVGDDIVFDHGAYQPETLEGRFVLAHEVAHAIQNREFGTRAAPSAKKSQEFDASESEANAFAHGAITGQSAPLTAEPSAVISTFAPWWMPPQLAALQQQSASSAKPNPPAPSQSEPLKPLETASTYLLDHPQSWGNFAEGINEARKSTAPGKNSIPGLPDGYGSGLSLLEGTLGMGLGMEKLTRGEYLDGGLQVASGAADSVSGVAGLGGWGKASNIAGGISDTITAAGGLYKAITSDDSREQTAGVQDFMMGGFDAVSNFAGGPTTPVGAVAAAGGLGVRAGRGLNNLAASQNYFGDNRTISEWGADKMRGTRDWVQQWDMWGAEDYLDDVAAFGVGLGASAYGIGETAVRGVGDAAWWAGGKVADGAEALWDAGGDAVDYIGDNFTLDPTEIEWDPREWF
jgi:Domain of unknown function (DUF4157)